MTFEANIVLRRETFETLVDDFKAVSEFLEQRRASNEKAAFASSDGRRRLLLVKR